MVGTCAEPPPRSIKLQDIEGTTPLRLYEWVLNAFGFLPKSDAADAACLPDVEVVKQLGAGRFGEVYPWSCSELPAGYCNGQVGSARPKP